MYFHPFYYLPGDFPVFPMYWNQKLPSNNDIEVLALKQATLENKASNFLFASGANFRIHLKQILPGKTFKSKTAEKMEIFLMVESGEVTLEYFSSAKQSTKKTLASGAAIIIPPMLSYLLTNSSSNPVKIYLLTVRLND